jgi:UDP-4-amino-4,6-dideoxy-N-acetyl-beta-L-altrosamine N-acetyltransferase
MILKVVLKRLTENELELMMNWRMREEIARGMFTDVKLTLEGQKKWFKKIKNDKTQIRWVIYIDDAPVGSMYLTDIDYVNKRCESGWFVAEKGASSFKFALGLQQNMFDYAFDTLKLNRNYGYVIDTNAGVLKILKLLGLEEEGVMRQHVFKDGEFHDVHVVAMTKDHWNQVKLKQKYDKYIIE